MPYRNVIAQGALPVGLLPNIIVDDKAYVVPMMVEEPSVVAAASYGAKLVNQTGGFKTVSSERTYALSSTMIFGNNPTGNAPCAMTFSIKLFATSSSINGQIV
jgi:hydroxymethylglutaryl-CoA reductase